MIIAVEGCAHGELEIIYETISKLEKKDNIKIDLLLCCGDFQASRNLYDLECMAVPQKFKKICSFYKYYSGEKKAPILTVLIGGNHEASNYFQELPFGGWVAPKIYYLGYAGVVNIAGIRIAGISGIYKGTDYMKGHFEKPPYDSSTIRSIYHIRNVEIFRLKQLSQPINIFLSHDWPSNICNYGNKNQLLRFKPHFENDITSGKLGSEPCEELLKILKPDYWFAAHLHCKFAALIPHQNNQTTKFLALDKCLPKRRFLQIINIPHNQELPINVNYDVEWLSILVLTNHLTSIKRNINYLPGPNSNERYNFTPTKDEIDFVKNVLQNNFVVPDNFVKTAVTYNKNSPNKRMEQPEPLQNQQTILFCQKFNIDDPLVLLMESSGDSFQHSVDFNTDDSLNETFIMDTTAESLILEDCTSTRSSLCLPKPKYGTDSVNEKNLLSKNDIVFNIDNNEKIKNNEINDDSGGERTPVAKKLKRRNIDLYKDDI